MTMNPEHPLRAGLAELRHVNVARCKRWHPGFPDDDWTITDWSNAAAGEMGEAANVAKKIRRAQFGHPGANDPDAAVLKMQLADEIADTVIYLDLLAAHAGIDLARAIEHKFNAVSVREGFPERLT